MSSFPLKELRTHVQSILLLNLISCYSVQKFLKDVGRTKVMPVATWYFHPAEFPDHMDHFYKSLMTDKSLLLFTEILCVSKASSHRQYQIKSQGGAYDGGMYDIYW